jgi:uncharacterized protein (TIGR02117 family)
MRTTGFVCVPVDLKAARSVRLLDLGSHVGTVPFRQTRYEPKRAPQLASPLPPIVSFCAVARWGRRISLILLVAWGLLLATRCHLPRQTVDATPDSTSAVYVVKHGRHAGIAVRRAEVPDDRWPVLDDFPNARYLEVGWGEARYYPGRSRGVWGVLRAGLWPTSSVLHVVPIDGAVLDRFPKQAVIRVPVGEAELDALLAFVAESFAVDSTGRAPVAAPGYYADSRFYRSPLPYHVFNNCNHWAAAALEAAGCDGAPRWVFTVGQVVAQAKECGALVQQGTGG